MRIIIITNRGVNFLRARPARQTQLVARAVFNEAQLKRTNLPRMSRRAETPPSINFNRKKAKGETRASPALKLPRVTPENNVANVSSFFSLAFRAYRESLSLWTPHLPLVLPVFSSFSSSLVSILRSRRS